MAPATGSETVLIDAPPQAVFDALTDFESMPEWQSPVVACEVVERDAEGRGLVVDFEIDLKIRHVRYRLRHEFAEPHRIGSVYLGGDFRDFTGDWRIEPVDGGSRVTVQASIDPGRFVPRPLKELARERALRTATRDLKRHLESARAHA